MKEEKTRVDDGTSLEVIFSFVIRNGMTRKEEPLEGRVCVCADDSI